MTKTIKVIEKAASASMARTIEHSTEPLLFKGALVDWPLIQKSNSSVQLVEHLTHFYTGLPVNVSVAAPDKLGRLFYNDDFTALNFSRQRMNANDALQLILKEQLNETPTTYYIASASLDAYFKGLKQQHNLAALFDAFAVPPSSLIDSIWIGNKTTASCHYDAPHNLACCVAGKRRVTLFPPEQIINLYPGPLELTPGGQVVSLVDFSEPDFDQFPRFRDALDAAILLEMEPGDMLFIPSMWWHQIEALNTFNILINFWWDHLNPVLGNPASALLHAMMSFSQHSALEKQAWKALFDYYVFAENGSAAAHIPAQARGSLGVIDDNRARRLRMQLLNSLNK